MGMKTQPRLIDGIFPTGGCELHLGAQRDGELGTPWDLGQRHQAGMGSWNMPGTEEPTRDGELEHPRERGANQGWGVGTSQGQRHQAGMESWEHPRDSSTNQGWGAPELQPNP